LEQDDFTRRIDGLLEKRRARQSDHLVQIEALKRQQQDCLLELSRYEVSQHQHDKLHDKLQQLSSEYYNEDCKMNDIVEARRRQAFDMKMEMDKVFRKTLSSIESTYQTKSCNMVEEEAMRARDAVNVLTQSSQSREKECMSVIRRQQASYDKMIRAKVNLDVLNTTTPCRNRYH